MSVFAFIGALMPDIDIRFYHRKLAHNIWFLILIIFLSMKLGLMDPKVAIAFSAGFISHLIGDAMTHMGIMPLWPIPQPKFNGPIKTGGFGEFIVMIVLLVSIFWITGYLKL